MTESRRLLLLHEAEAPPPELEALAQALREQGAQVQLLRCAPPYEAVLAAVAAADTHVFWR